MLNDGRSRGGYTLIELIVGVTVGALVAGSAISLCNAANLAVGQLLSHQWAWQEIQAGAALWATEFRGAGYDPRETAGAGISVAQPDTLTFSSDWNASGAVLPTASNPNERLEYVGVANAWKRGVNGGPRLRFARPDSVAFAYRDSLGELLGQTPDPASIRIVDAEVTIDPGDTPLVWSIAVRALHR